MNKNLTIRVMKVFLNILLVLLGAMSLEMISTLIDSITRSGTENIMFSLRLITYPIYFLIIYNLRKIVYSTDSTPFCFENVKRFRLMGYFMFIIAIFDAIIRFKRAPGLEILATSYGSLKGSFFLYIVLACSALILAEIFKKAVEIKNENDLTI